MLESALKEQLKGIFANLEGNFTLISMYPLNMNIAMSWLSC